MKKFILLLNVACLFILGSSNAAKVLQYSLSQDSDASSSGSQGKLEIRQTTDESATTTETVTQELLYASSRGVYYVPMKVGTPPQSLKLWLSTGSNGLIVFDKNGTCSQPGSSCVTPFNSNASTSLDAPPGGFPFYRGLFEGTVKGREARDVITIGKDTSLTVSFGLVNEIPYPYKSGSGILGLAYRYSPQAQGSNTTLVDRLVLENIINSRFYSISLGSSNSSSVLFGGVDTEKYVGELIDIPAHIRTRFALSTVATLKSIVPSDPEVGPFDFQPTNVTLDTASSALFLPDKTVQSIYKSLLPKLIGTAPYMPCNASSNSYLSFVFDNNAVIKVPYSELVVPVASTRRRAVPRQDMGIDACILNIYPQQGENVIPSLGHPFFRSAYVAFDADNERIYLAQSNTKSVKTNLVEVPAGVAEFPLSESKRIAASISASLATSLPSSTANPGLTATTTRSIAGPKAEIGIGVMGALGLMGLLVV